MKLALRFLLSTLLGILVVVAGGTALNVRREVAVFDADLQRDHRVLAHSLAPAFAMTWEHDGPSAALRLLDQVNTSEGFLRSRWIPADSSEVPGPDLVRGSEGVVQTVQGGAQDREIVTFAPVRLPRASGFIEIRESTNPRSRYVTESIIRAVLGGLGLLAWCGASSMALGTYFIGRPVQALVTQARKIGSGQFEARSSSGRADELDALGQEMNQMAEILEQNRRKLQEETHGRLEALNQLRHADRLATAGKLASGIAHELGTPLNVVSGRAKLIRNNEGASPELRRNAQIIEDQVVRMTRIIRQLLDFARAGESHRTAANARDLVERARGLLLPLAKKQGARIDLDEPIEDAHIDADVGQMEQVLSNLIVNALQAMRDQGVVTLRSSTKRLMPPGSTRADDYAVIEVRDTGPGMPPQIMTRVFEPFFTTKGVGEGTGLGLSVAYGMVQEHGGFLSVASSPGHGSCFSVHLPLAQPQSRRAEPLSNILPSAPA
jgi:two-component system NtrC family sensor kinase